MKKTLSLTLGLIFIWTVSLAQTQPQLTKEETLTLENIQLRQALINQQITDLQARTKEAKETIEKAHPGYTLAQTQQGFQLVKTPDEKPKTDAPKAAH
jgi:regulator of replication initiation timing